MTTPLIRRAVTVLLGDPRQLADRIQLVFGEHGVAATCKVVEILVEVEVSTLGLEGEDADERVESWIAQAAVDVAARIEWSDPSS